MDGRRNRNSEDKNKNCEDIQIDAHIDPDDNNLTSSSPASLLSESVLSVQASCKSLSDASSNVQSTSSEESVTSSQETLRFTQTARPVSSADEDEYKKHIEQMPDNLREENIDILIVHADCDRKAAAYFQNHLTKDIVFKIYDQPRHPRVKLLDEIRHGSMDHLDFAFNKSLYIFLFVTKDFCEEPWTLLQGQACLTEAIHDVDKKWCVVPIHTTSKKNRCYKLPMMLNSLRPINYWSGNEDQFYIEGVRRLLESKTSLLLERERLLVEGRRKHFEKYRTQILENAKYKDKGMSVHSQNFSYQACASDCSPLNDDVAASSKPSAVHTGSGDDVYQTEVYRYSSFTSALDKALLEESLPVVEERIEAMAAAANKAVDQNNDLHVNIRCPATNSSSQRSDQEEVLQHSERSGEMRRLQQPSDRSQNQQSQEMPQQVPGRSREIQNQSILQNVSDRSCEEQGQGILQQVSGRSHERQNQSLPLQATCGSHVRLNEGLPQQAPGRSQEQQNQGRSQKASERSHERYGQGIPKQAGSSHQRQNQGIPQQSHFSAMSAVNSGMEHRGNRNNSFTTEELNSVDIDGPGDDSSSVPIHRNRAPHVYHPQRSVPSPTVSSFQYNNTSYANASSPQMMPRGITTPDHPTASPMLGQVHYPFPNYVNPHASCPYYNPYLHPHMYPSFPSQHYPQVQPCTMQDLYYYANPIPPPSYLYQSDLRSHSQTNLEAASNDSMQTSMEGNSPDSVQSDLSHSSSTGALSTVASLPGLSHHWPPLENLSESDVPFHPQPASDRHIPTSDPQINQPAEGAHATTAQQPQSHTPFPAEQQRSFETNYSEIGQTTAAAGTHSSSKSERAFSAVPSSAATSVIQHIHHHHHKKTITVAKATNVLIGDKSQILNKHSAHVISDDESGGDDDDDEEDAAEASVSRDGASNFTRFTENSYGSYKKGRGASGDVHSGKEDSKNVPVGFTEFLSPPSCRQPVERSDSECAETDDAEDQTNAKKML